MRSIIFAIFLLIFGACANGQAQNFYVPGSNNSTINGFDAGSYPFQNFVKGGSYSTAQGASLAKGLLNSDGYPSGVISPNLNWGTLPFPPSQSAAELVWAWSGLGTWEFLGQYAHVVSASAGTTVFSCSPASPPCNVANNFAIRGTNPVVVWDLGLLISAAVNSANTPGICSVTVPNNPFTNGTSLNVSGIGGATGCNGSALTVANVSGNTFDLTGSTWGGPTYTSGGQAYAAAGISSLFLVAGGTFTSNTGMVICRQADYNNDGCGDTATNPYFLPEFLTSLGALKVARIRPLDSSHAVDGTAGVSWANRQRITQMSYGSTWVPNYWTTTLCSGTATICGGDAYTAAAAPGTPAQMTDGEVFQGQFLNANTTTTPTLNVGARGAFPIYNKLGTLQNATLGGSPTTNDVLHFTFTETDSQSTCIPAGAYTFSYTVKVSDTTLGTLGASLTTAAQADTTLNGAHIFFANAGSGLLTINYNVNCGGGITFTNSVTGAVTETITQGYQTASTFAAGSNWTFTFSAILKAWLATNEGIDMRWPVETQVALANALGIGLWYDIPFFATNGAALNGFAASDTYVQSLAAYMKANLTGGLWIDYTNEAWNFANPQTNVAASLGAALGFTQGAGGNNPLEQINDYFGLQTRLLIGGTVTSSWGGASPSLHRILGNWYIGDDAGTVNQRLNGIDLTSSGNATYGAIIGTNYNVSPNRPVDLVDGLSYATYTQGTVLNGGATSVAFNGSTGNSVACVPASLGTASDIGCMTAAADAFNSGNTAASRAWMDNDIVAGTSNGTAGQETLSWFNVHVYPAWKTIASSYAGHPLIIYNYEGSPQTQTVPAASSCTAVSITAATYCGSSGRVTLMIADYRTSTNFQAVVLAQYQQMVAGSPANSSPAWFTFGLDGPWSLYPVDIFGTPYAPYNAIKSFNTN